jgi:hypothetical protein
MVHLVREAVLLDVAPHEPDLVLLDPSISLFERQLPSAQAFDLAPHQHDPALQGVEHRVVVSGLAVVGDGLFVLVVGLLGRRFVFLLLSRGDDSSMNVELAL